MTTKRVFISFIFLYCSLTVQSVWGQRPSTEHPERSRRVKFYTVASENHISYRQTFQVQYNIEGSGNVRQFTVPAFKDFRVEDVFDFNQPSTQPTAWSKIVVLSPKKSGRFVIPGATAIIDGKLWHSKTTTVVVQQTGLSSVQDNEDIDTEEASVIRPGESVDEKINKNLFLRTEVNKTNCYVGESLMAVYKAYSRLNTSSSVTKRPSFTGFSVLEMVDSYDNKPEIEMVKGQPYYVNIIRKVQLFPLQAGVFTLDPAEVESLIHFIKINEGGPRTFMDHRVTLRSTPVNVTVKPLPVAGQPTHFSGAVGNFSLHVLADSAAIHPGELVKIQVMIRGTGNISLLTPPVVAWPMGVDTADPSVREAVNRYVYPLAGSKTFEYSFAAPDTGHYTVPVVHLPYYDPVQKAYRTASSTPLTLKVTAGISKEEAQQRTVALASENGSSVPRQLYWFGLVVVLIVGWIVYQSIHLQKSNRMATQEKITTVTPAVQVEQPIIDRLGKARGALQRGDHPAFFREIQQALWNLAAEVSNVMPSSLNKQNIAAKLADKGASPAIIQNFTHVLTICEWALYAPTTEEGDLHQLLAQTEQVLNDLQKV